ncbi:hypothetical protein Tco_0821966 [Tanacetum coccineum]|uniref:Uncharacterized protein n=1 Tax=Tanacetum coccineum TaxID=301880 RepID=A0ABQ5AGD3_9ASTR
MCRGSGITNSQDSRTRNVGRGSITYTKKDVPSRSQETDTRWDRLLAGTYYWGVIVNQGGRNRERGNLGINYHPSERKWNFCLNSFIESNIMNNHVFQHFRPYDHMRGGDSSTPMLNTVKTKTTSLAIEFRIDQLEANLERFKIDQAAINSEATKQWAFLQAMIEKNKVEADRQFAEIMNALKALQPLTTLPATIPHFEENRRQSFSGKEVKDNCFKEDICTCVGVLELANSQDSTNPTWAGDQSRIREKDVPSHGPRKRHLGGQIFGLELIIGLHCDPGRGEDRITWNPRINYHPSERKWNFCLNSFIESNIMNNYVFQHFRPDDRHERTAVKRRVWDPGITGGEC